jgi:hypothetical protein
LRAQSFIIAIFLFKLGSESSGGSQIRNKGSVLWDFSVCSGLEVIKRLGPAYRNSDEPWYGLVETASLARSKWMKPMLAESSLAEVAGTLGTKHSW